VAIHATANPANVRRSVEKYLLDTFGGATGLPTDIETGNWWWQGRKIDVSGLDYFVRVGIQRIAQTLYSRVTSSAPGATVAFILMLEVYAKRAVYDTTPHILEQAQAMFRNGLTRGTAIALKDYEENAGSATTQQYLVVEDPRIPVTREEGEWLRSSWDVTLTTIEQDTAS